MRGNYQEEEPPMKFSPESSATDRTYQSQQYRPEFNISQPKQTEIYSLTGVKDNEDEALS